MRTAGRWPLTPRRVGIRTRVVPGAVEGGPEGDRGLGVRALKAANGHDATYAYVYSIGYSYAKLKDVVWSLGKVA